jgi:hypothetical protein
MTKIVRTAIEASGGSIEHVARYMLAGSLVLIIVGMMVAFALV